MYGAGGLSVDSCFGDTANGFAAAHLGGSMAWGGPPACRRAAAWRTHGLAFVRA